MLDQIREKVPAIGLQTSELVIFPHSTISFYIGEGAGEDIEALREHPFGVVIPVYMQKRSTGFEEIEFRVGIIGKVSGLEEIDGTHRLDFKGIMRVNYVHLPKSRMVRWVARPDIPLTPEEKRSGEIREAINMIKQNYAKFLSLVRERIAPGAEDFFSREFVQETAMRVRDITPESVSPALDGIMNVLNNTVVAEADEAPIDISIPSLAILSEQTAKGRLMLVARLLYMLIFGMTAENKTEDKNLLQQFEKQYKNKKSKVPEEAQREIEREISRLKRGMHTSEASMVQSHLELLLDLPWGILSETTQDLREAKRVLDEDHEGLEKVKERILEHLALRKHGKNTSPSILCFIGPPGVGKTSLGQSIARALGRKFMRLSLGGLRDEADIKGHSGTYINAKPGQIMELIRRAGEANPVFMLDEIDKISLDWRGDPASALLEVLDPKQNSMFRDTYVNVPFDLSQVFFICTGNTTGTIPAPLLDRLELIELPGYTPIEKLAIAKNHLIPKIRKESGLPITRPDGPELDIWFTEGAIRKLILEHTQEAGVRNLEREIRAICGKVLKMYEMGEIPDRSEMKIWEGNLHKFVGKPRVYPESIFAEVPIGCVPMFAVSQHGGHFFYVEARIDRGRPQRKIKVTGVLGSGTSKQVVNLIEESIDIALDNLVLEGGILHSSPEETKSRGEFYIHVNVRDGGIPKEGPSAGVPMLWLMYSLLTDQPIMPRLGATGEIDLRLGAVGAVGGIRDKVLAAHRAKIKKFVLPKDNLIDLEEVPSEIKAEIEFIGVETVWEALCTAFPNDTRLTEFASSHSKSPRSS